ncbi:MAG: hypothetical protein AB1589_15400 [Cyanobacteriota bacterium]
MYYRSKDKYYRANIWSFIDPLKVKQRIDGITHKLEEVQRQYEPSPNPEEGKDSLVQGEGRQGKGEAEIAKD